MKRIALAWLVGLSIVVCSGAWCASTPGVKVGDSVVTVKAGTAPVFEYRYTDVPFKPYVVQFFTPSGVNVLRDAPSDHHHHHGLMYAISVDGVSFWQEDTDPGRQIHRAFEELGDTNPKAKQTGFIERLDWLLPKDDQIALKEKRTVAALQGKTDLGASLITWESAFTLPAGKKKAELTGSHYYGLGMRYVESMDKVGTFFNADGTEGELVRGTEYVTPSKWCAYTAEADGHPVTVAMFDHPKNARHPAMWFTMTHGFSYMAATLNLWKEPMTITEGDDLTLRYGVALWDGHMDKKTVEELYQRWLDLVR
jgi:methane monooxygenase PmoA-like